MTNTYRLWKRENENWVFKGNGRTVAAASRIAKDQPGNYAVDSEDGVIYFRIPPYQKTDD